MEINLVTAIDLTGFINNLLDQMEIRMMIIHCIV